MSRYCARDYLCTCILFFLCLKTSAVFGDETIVVGRAYDKDEGVLIYNEVHSCSADRGLCAVDFYDIAGEMIASKTLDYGSGPFRPSLVMTDYRREKEWRLDAPVGDTVVVDAGFDNYVRSRWDALASGGVVQFDFLVPGRDAAIAMRARRDDVNSCDDGNFCVLVGLDSWLLAGFIDPIRLSYSSDTRELLSYDGPGNLASGDGSTPQVVIHYERPGSRGKIFSGAELKELDWSGLVKDEGAQ